MGTLKPVLEIRVSSQNLAKLGGGGGGAQKGGELSKSCNWGGRV